jgi:hypothetical protein
LPWLADGLASGPPGAGLGHSAELWTGKSEVSRICAVCPRSEVRSGCNRIRVEYPSLSERPLPAVMSVGWLREVVEVGEDGSDASVLVGFGVEIEAGEDGADVGFNSLAADGELGGDCGVRGSLGH